MSTPGPTIAVEVEVINSYGETGEVFDHRLRKTVPAPDRGDDIEDWIMEHLFDLTGEGPDYEDLNGLYEIKILSVPMGFEFLIGRQAGAMG